MGKTILLVLLSATGGSGLNRWEQPAVTSAQFEDAAACEAAIAVIRQWEKDRRLDNVSIRAVCLPAAK